MSPIPYKIAANRIRGRILISAMAFLVAETALACSTFVLDDGEQRVYGHHLDANPTPVPGLVVINKRGADRKSISWEQLITRRVDAHPISWTSRWGSITFNTWGLGFPDGGLNERGVYIQEMSLAGSTAPTNRETVMLASVWMQYVLDNFETTTQVIHNASEFVIQGNPAPSEWHFFVADGKGRKAVIEFINRKLVVHQDSEVSVPLLCNSPYADELDRWRTFESTNSAMPTRGDVRFIRGARVLAETSGQGLSPDRARQVLDAIKSSGTQWTYIFDVPAKQVRYRTKKNPTWREFNWSDADFAAGPALAWDINDSEKEHWFRAISSNDHTRFVSEAMDVLLKQAGGERFDRYLQSFGGSLQDMRDEIVDYTHWTQ